MNLAKRPAGQQEERLELQMTSMIDVVFLLLIFFMVTAAAVREEAMIETHLPRADEQGEVKVEDPTALEFKDVKVSLELDEFGNVTRKVNDQEVYTPGQMYSMLRPFAELNRNGRVVLWCQDEVPYESVVEAISVAQAVGLSISFARAGAGDEAREE